MAWAWLRRLLGGGGDSAARAREQFAAGRAGLHGRFFEAAGSSGKPRGLVWKSLDWGPCEELARERATGRLAMLAEVTIAFEAEAGGDMEGVEAVGNLRNASAVFFYHRGGWHTTGKAIFNLNPDEVIERLAAQYERAG